MVLERAKASSLVNLPQWRLNVKSLPQEARKRCRAMLATKGTHESVPHFLGVSCAGGGITNMKKPETAMLSRNKARQPSSLMSVSLIMVDKYIHRT